MKHGEKTLLKY